MTIGEVRCLENSRPKGLVGSTPSASAPVIYREEKIMREDFSGTTVLLKDGINDPYMGAIPAGSEYDVEGYWDDLTGGSWMFANGNPAALNYAIRSATIGLPLDNNVLYGKVGAFGYLVHVSEIERV